MPVRPKVTRLPKDVREELDRRIVAGGFSDYEALAKWLSEQGYEIGRCAVQRHGAKLEECLRAIKISTEAARAIVSAAPDDEGAMNDALVRLVQKDMFAVLVEAERALETKDLTMLARATADLVRASISQKGMMQQMREKLAAQLKTAGAKVDEAASQGGLSPDAEKKIRDALLDIRV